MRLFFFPVYFWLGGRWSQRTLFGSEPSQPMVSVDAGRDIRAGILNPAAKSGAFASARHGLAIEPAAEEHTNFHAITRAAQRGECNQGRDGGDKQGNNDSDFQIRPL